MRRVHAGPLGALAGTTTLLAVLVPTTGLGAAGWLVGSASAVVVAACLAAAMSRHRTRALGPADRVTLVRSVLVCGVAALAAPPGTGAVGALVGLSAVALVLDAVDGPVARRTGTVSELGARFDLEVDAFLILVLSAYVAPSVGWWVLAIGLARYAFVGAGLALPWLRATLPPRRWCKVVAAIQGIVLTVVAAGLLPLWGARTLLAAAALMLAESFGREVRDLRRLRDTTVEPLARRPPAAAGVVEPVEAPAETGVVEPVEALAETGVVEPVEALAETGVVEPVEALAETVSKPGEVGGDCAGAAGGFDAPRRLGGSTSGGQARLALVEPVEALAETVSKPSEVGGDSAGAAGGFDAPRRLGGSTSGGQARLALVEPVEALAETVSKPSEVGGDSAGVAGGFDAPRRLGGSTTGRAGGPATAGAVWAVLSLALLWAALLLPDRVGDLTLVTFAAVPVEGLVLAALLLLLPRRAGRVLAVVAGGLLAVLTLVRFLDMGFRVALDRRFDPVWDPAYLGPGVELLVDSVGRPRAVLAVSLAVVLCACVLVLVPMASVRLAGLARRHRRTAVGVLATLALVWMVGALAGARVGGTPVAAASTAASATAHVTQVVDGVRDRPAFLRDVADDRLDDAPAGRLLAGLRGKDVLLVFVESYGRVALDGSLGGSVRPLLRDATRTLAATGFSSRSAYLTSPTFGGASWLAHATLQSGVWVDSQQRHEQLLSGQRLTLSRAFAEAGWRTLGVAPANKSGWPEGQAFYEFDTMYDASNLGYEGPKFGYARMPDQYTLATFWRRELADPSHAPLMAEVDLVSSHHPWAPIPRMLGWADVDDTSRYDEMAKQGPSREEVWSDRQRLGAAYLASVRYSLTALVDFTARYGGDDLVLVVLGDHQPTSVLTGEGVGYDVPVSLVSSDPAVLRRIASWGWRPGLDPGPDGPVSRMDGFRDRFLTSFAGGLNQIGR